MLHLFNNQVGFAKKDCGFPSVDGCNAIVYQTKVGLCGYHAYGGGAPDQDPGRAAAFAGFAQSEDMLHADKASFLYSVINKRYDSTKQETRQRWIDEMRAYAKALNFAGTVYLIALRKNLDAGSVYIQFDVDGLDTLRTGGCIIRYQNWSAMKGIKATGSPGGVQQMRPDRAVIEGNVARRIYALGAPNEYDEVFERVENPGGMLHVASGENTANAFIFSFEGG